MKRFLSVAGVVAMVLAAVPAMAQSKPDFSGKWTLLSDPTAASSGRGRIGDDFTVSQNDKTLTTTANNPARTDLNAVYNLDGSASASVLRVEGSKPFNVERVSKARWEGSKLVIASTINYDGKPSEATQTWSLDASGNLVIEMTWNITGTATTTKATYKKA